VVFIGWGGIPGVTVRKILGAGAQDAWIRKSDNGACSPIVRIVRGA